MAWEGTPWKLGFLCLQVVSVTLRYVARFLLDRKVPAVMIIVLNRQQSQVLGAARAPHNPLDGLGTVRIKQRPGPKAVVLEGETERWCLSGTR